MHITIIILIITNKNMFTIEIYYKLRNFANCMVGGIFIKFYSSNS